MFTALRKSVSSSLPSWSKNKKKNPGGATSGQEKERVFQIHFEDRSSGQAEIMELAVPVRNLKQEVKLKEIRRLWQEVYGFKLKGNFRLQSVTFSSTTASGFRYDDDENNFLQDERPLPPEITHLFFQPDAADFSEENESDDEDQHDNDLSEHEAAAQEEAMIQQALRASLLDQGAGGNQPNHPAAGRQQVPQPRMQLRFSVQRNAKSSSTSCAFYCEVPPSATFAEIQTEVRNLAAISASTTGTNNRGMQEQHQLAAEMRDFSEQEKSDLLLGNFIFSYSGSEVAWNLRPVDIALADGDTVLLFFRQNNLNNSAGTYDDLDMVD
ncbi:unnamed protein product [Amoebophrya sp. A120]|nr:unnamed protein product [Amoebophrya sp. A120]|eukprot:GSA120T00006318001.1